jgi:hypothetical protein
LLLEVAYHEPVRTGLAGIVVLVLWADVAAENQRTPSAKAAGQQIETYESAEIDPSGNIRIITSDRRTIMVMKDLEQTSFEPPLVSPDRTAVGAQANYSNCCTSYDVPLKLVVYSHGKAHRFKGVELPIFQWHFADSGTRVAYSQEPVHFGCEIHYELRDIESERLVETADIPEPCGQRPDPPPTTIPLWVKQLQDSLRPR